MGDERLPRTPPRTWPRPRGSGSRGGEGGERGAGRALTLVNWCTMMCRQCRFMSSACVLSAASRIWNGSFLEGLLPLSRTRPGSGRPGGPSELPEVHSAPSRSSPGSACSTPAAGCCRSRNSRGPRTGSCGLVKELPARGAHLPTTSPSPPSGRSRSPGPAGAKKPEPPPACSEQGNHPNSRGWPRAPLQLTLYTDS